MSALLYTPTWPRVFQVSEITSCDTACKAHLQPKDCVVKMFIDMDEDVHDDLVAEAAALTLANTVRCKPSSGREALPAGVRPRGVASAHPSADPCLLYSMVMPLPALFPIVQLRAVIKTMTARTRGDSCTSTQGEHMQVKHPFAMPVEAADII